MICQKCKNYSLPPVDTACGNVEFCNALPEGSGFVLLRRDKVYLSIRLRIKLRRTSRGAVLRARLEIARDVPPYFDFSQNSGQILILCKFLYMQLIP